MSLRAYGSSSVPPQIQLAQSGLLFAPPSANPKDLGVTRKLPSYIGASAYHLIVGSILELGTFHALRTGNLKSYASYDSSLQPFYDNLSDVLSPSPNQPVILGLRLLYWLSEGDLTSFHTIVETLEPAQLQDVFVKLAVDL